MVSQADILQNAIANISRMGLPTGNVGMSGAESQAYDSSVQLNQQQAQGVAKADKDLAAIDQAKVVAYEDLLMGVTAQADAEQAKSQQIADNNRYFNELVGIGVSPDSIISQLAQYKGQVIAPQLLDRVQKQVELSQMSPFDDPLLGLALPDAQAQVTNQVTALKSANEVLDAAISDAVVNSQNLANRINSAIPTVTLAEKEARLKQERAKTDLQIQQVNEGRVKDSVNLLNQQTAALLNANQSVIAKASSQRQIQQWNIGQAQEAVRFAMGKEQWLAATKMELAKLQEQEGAEEQLLILANQGAKMTGNQTFQSLEAFKGFQKAAPDLAERLVAFGLGGSMGNSPADAAQLMINPKTKQLLLGNQLGPAATKAAQITVSAARSVQLTPAELAKAKDKKEQEALRNGKINERVAQIFANPADRAANGLNVPPASEVFQVYSRNSAFAEKYKLHPETVKALAPLAQSKAQANDNTIVQTMVAALEAKGFKPEQIASQVSTYFAGATTLRNSQVDGQRFGFNNEPRVAAAMKTYETRVTLPGGDMGIDVTKPSDVKNYLLRRKRETMLGGSSPFLFN